MRKAIGWVTLAWVASGCLPARVVQAHLNGPQGEDDLEMSCVNIGRCFDLARQECGGDFDIVASGTAIGVSGKRRQGPIATTWEDMVVRCASPRPEAPVPGRLGWYETLDSRPSRFPSGSPPSGGTLAVGLCAIDRPCPERQVCVAGVSDSGICHDR